tara:strand:- start:939 stop:1124 length:186 start_codon:yes stop_codon:yes gene_type:complete
MKIKLKNPQALPNAWKSCGMNKEDWMDLQAGKAVEVKSVPELLKDKIDVENKPTSKPKGDK